MASKQRSNVIKMAPPETDLDEQIRDTYAVAMASFKAVDEVKQRLDQALKDATKKWKSAIDQATEAHFARLRAEAPPVEGDVTDFKGKGMAKLKDEYARRHLASLQEVAEIDSLATQRDTELEARKARLTRVTVAYNDCKGVDPRAAQQLDFFANPDAQVMPALAWAGASTKDVIYTALRHRKNEGIPLDPLQQHILDALSGAGLEVFDLGFEAASAVETDAQEEELDDEAEDGVGF